MKDTLVHILTALTLHPEAVEVNEVTEEEERIIFVVKVHPEDMGRIIGKQGRIIRAIRDLMKVIATKEDKYVDVELVEESTSTHVSP